MKPVVTIRDAAADEHPRLLQLVMDSYEEYREFLTAEFFEQFRQDVIGLLAGDHIEVLVADVDGAPAGIVVFYPDGQYYGPGLTAGFGSLRVLAVHPAFRRLGVGRKLMNECLERARGLGHRRMLLHTLPFMPNAIALHESLGYQRAPEFDVAYTPEVTVIAFVRDL